MIRPKPNKLPITLAYPIIWEKVQESDLEAVVISKRARNLPDALRAKRRS
jgi:hypothetical protein